jgi:hypothetical protein
MTIKLRPLPGTELDVLLQTNFLGCAYEEILGVARKHKCGHVIWNQRFAGELPDRIQNGPAQGLGI